MNNRSITTVIDLLRHGDVEGGRKYRGQLDDPLSELGWQQLRSSTNKKQDWQHIITSPLKRCAAFAEELAQAHTLPLDTKNEFQEISFGLWEGKTAEELLSTETEFIKEYWNSPVKMTPPQGENLLDFEKRIITGWTDMVTEFQGQHVLLISHAGVMRVILCHILGMPLTALFKLDVGLAKASRIQIENTDGESWPRLIFHGSEFI
ncbi:MAG: alpha-ribazole phosphatase family protein [Gammaproteobacteria bacterium]|nr:alpha-ribazole phosphatase family protein [Gammaproteobacteria bacterium]MCW8988543.1 alpha-ribazole phosphatase family protein [Gammaproteobacteria bacterium]